MHRLRPFALAALLAAGAAVAEPQKKPAEAPEPRPGPVVKSVDVTVTNLDVVVTDSKGARVKGLTRDDFEVVEDGQKQILTNFFAVDGGRVVFFGDEPVAGPGEAAAPAPGAAEPAVAPLPVPKTRLVIFVDNLNIAPFNRNRILRNVQDFVRTAVKGNVEAMVVTWDRSLKVRRKFTNDGRDVADVLRQLEEVSASGQQRESERRDLIREIDDAKTADEAVLRARSYAQSYKSDLDFTLDALKKTLNQLSGVDGRKIMIYVSDGLPQSPGAEIWKYIQDRFREATATLAQFEFDRTTGYLGIVQAANAAGVSMYTIDSSGLAVDSGFSAENRSMASRIDTFVEKTNMQSMLTLMADETGGRSILNRNEVTIPLQEIEQDYTSYYSLGYRSLRPGVDRPHSVDVKVKRKGLVARARRSYVEKGIETRVSEAVTSALYFSRDENPLAVGIDVGEPAPADRQNYFVPVRVRVPYSRITLLPDGPKARGRLIFYFIVIDSDGKQSDLTQQVLPLELETKSLDAYAKRDLTYDVRLLMIPGGQRLSLAVRDEPSSTVSYLQRSIFVSALPPDQRPRPSK